MLSLINDREDKIRLELATNLHRLIPYRCFTGSAVTDITRLAIVSLADFKKVVSTAYMNLLQSLSPAITLASPFLFLVDKSYEKENISVAHYHLGNGFMWKEKMMADLKDTSGSFQRTHFSNVLSSLTHFNDSSKRPSPDWLVRMFYACDTLDKITNEEQLGEDRSLSLVTCVNFEYSVLH